MSERSSSLGANAKSTRARVALCAAGVAFCVSSAVGASQLDAPRIRAWSDQHFNEALAQRRANGVVIAVVQNGQTILLQGYGYEDAGRELPIEAAATQIRICSNSKTFTATALLQLLDAGRIASIDDPANRYLTRFQLPRVDDRDISIRDLLTHRAGFGQGRFNEETASATAAPTSAADYRRLLGGFTNTPDTVSSYSNSNAAVLGAMIEDISGQSVGAYLREHIFEPLGMTHSELHAGGPAPQRVATPYRYFPNGSQERVILFGKHPVYAPSGGVISTAQDMARFLVAHADEGRTAGVPLLHAATFTRMHTQTVANHPALDGFGLQYFTSRSRKGRVAFHTCSLPGFSSAQAIFPDIDAGVFIAVVAEQARAAWWEHALAPIMETRMTRRDGVPFGRPLDASDALDDLRRAVAELEPEFSPLPAAPQPTTSNLRQYLGDYVVDRRPVGSLISLAAALNGMRRVALGADATLVISDRSYRQIAPDVFERADAVGSRYAFLKDQRGRVVRMVGVSSAFTRVRWLDNPALAAMLILCVALVAMTGLLAFRWPAQSALARAGKWAMILSALAGVAIVWSISFGFEAAQGVRDISDAIGIGSTPRLWVVLAAGNVLATSALVMLAVVVPAWSNRWWGGEGRRAVCRRLHFTLMTAITAVLLPFLANFHVVGLRITPPSWPQGQFSVYSEHGTPALSRNPQSAVTRVGEEQ